MNENEQDILEQEVESARRAEQAYNLYLKEYIRLQNEFLFAKFIDPNTSSEEAIAIRHTQRAFNALQEGILQDIETGKLATISLNKLNGE